MSVTIPGAIRENKLYAGKKVEIRGMNNQTWECMAKVIQFRDDTVILEVYADVFCSPEQLKREEEIMVRFIVPDDASYSFTGAVVSYNESANILLLEQLSTLTRIEQRSCYRLKTTRPMYFSLAGCEDGDMPSATWVEGCLLDISRIGARLMIPLVVRPGCLLKLLIPLEEVSYDCEVQARVVHSFQEDGQSILGVKFEELTLQDEERVLEFILKVWSGGKDGQGN